MEQRLEALLAAQPLRCVRDVLPAARRAKPYRPPGAVLRQHRGPRSCLGGRRERGQENQALGRSRGGFSTKIHLKTDLDGNPLDFHLTGGEVSDTTQFETSLDLGPDITPRVAITDKGYDSRTNREAAHARGVTPVIPRRETSKERGRFFPKKLYKLRARIEQTIGKLKRFKRIALRCDKTTASFAAFISFACSVMLIKSVHTA
ncbi:MAG TPA: IS5 family transposase [Acidobacteriaceae bacterium]|nr:IS5 family transposase [Acidobacteriaceae bacterium]